MEKHFLYRTNQELKKENENSLNLHKGGSFKGSIVLPNLGDSILKLAIDYMHQNLNQNLSLKQASKMCFVSPSYFSKLFSKGMLTAAVCVDVFASPSTTQVYNAIEDVKADQGILLIIKNYSGDCMNFEAAAGDGDFGMSISKGFKHVLKEIDEIDISNITVFIRGCAMIIMEHCGGASGPIWGSAFMAASRSVKGKEALKKAVGEGKGLTEAFADATKAAQDGAEYTKTIVARKGRASYLGERSLNHPDAGAMAVGVLFKELTK